MSKSISAVALLAALVSANVNAQDVPAGKIAVYGFGESSCGSFNTEDERFRSIAMTWVDGYMTGLMDGGLKLKAQQDHVGAFTSWITSYCQSHPLVTLVNAAQHLSYELSTK